MALEAARSTQPDLVLLDVMMPHLFGSQTCRALRRDPVTANACPTKPADVPLLLQTLADLTGSA